VFEISYPFFIGLLIPKNPSNAKTLCNIRNKPVSYGRELLALRPVPRQEHNSLINKIQAFVGKVLGKVFIPKRDIINGKFNILRKEEFRDVKFSRPTLRAVKYS
jgi:hypothetical protein